MYKTHLKDQSLKKIQKTFLKWNSCSKKCIKNFSTYLTSQNTLIPCNDMTHPRIITSKTQFKEATFIHSTITRLWLKFLRKVQKNSTERKTLVASSRIEKTKTGLSQTKKLHRTLTSRGVNSLEQIVDHISIICANLYKRVKTILKRLKPFLWVAFLFSLWN